MSIQHSLKKISLSLLDPDPRNANVCTPDTLAKLRRNIQMTGFCPALTVRIHPDNPGRFMVIDGHHRLQILLTEGKTDATCEVLEITDSQAALLLATMNRLRGEDNPFKRAELLNGLKEHFSIDDLSRLLPETETEIQDLLNQLNFDENEAIEKIKAQLDKESASLPTILSFVLANTQLEIVNQALEKYQPSESKDPSEGLVAICLKALEQELTHEEA